MVPDIRTVTGWPAVDTQDDSPSATALEDFEERRYPVEVRILLIIDLLFFKFKNG